MRKTSLFASLMCVLISTSALGVGGNMGGTDPNGSPEKPYLIEDLADFDTFADPNNAATYWATGVHTKLMTDIDLSGRTYHTAVIGSFYGFLNGQSYVIDNLTIITSVATQGLAFIGSNQGEIANLGITNVSVTCEDDSSGIGGLVGFNYGTITDSYSTGHVVSNNQTGMVGGLVGYNSGIVACCYFIGNVQTGDDFVGIGGLVGYNHSTIANCYCNGIIFSGQSGGYPAGGLTGTNWRLGNISSCYSTCELISDGYAGGFVGRNGVAISNCFWNSDINPALSDSALGDLDEVFDKTTAEMMTQSTFTAWDFSTPVWMMLRPGEDYPRLAWQEVFLGDIAGLYGADMVDFSYLAKYWGLDCGTHDCGRADIDTSGDVGLGDLAKVAADWLR